MMFLFSIKGGHALHKKKVESMGKNYLSTRINRLPEYTQPEYTYKELQIYYSANIDIYNHAAMLGNPKSNAVILTSVELTDFVV